MNLLVIEIVEQCVYCVHIYANASFDRAVKVAAELLNKKSQNIVRLFRLDKQKQC